MIDGILRWCRDGKSTILGAHGGDKAEGKEKLTAKKKSLISCVIYTANPMYVK